jgi:phosphatidylglycerophosphatase A
MALKESSDELHPTMVPLVAIGTQLGSSRTAKDFFALAVSTCGVGYLPLAPGTWGSLVGVAFYLLLWSLSQRVLFANAAIRRFTLLEVATPQMAFMLMVIFLVSMAGIWAASRAERLFQRKDPGVVVIDEVAGQMIALLPGPFYVHTWWSIISAFVLFRAFDIWKPYPIRRLEKLESGLGIMADDIVAGIYAVIANTVLVSAYLLFLPGGR